MKNMKKLIALFLGLMMVATGVFALGALLPKATLAATNNVHNVTQNKWYPTLSAATAAANNDDVIEVHNSFTETATVKIQKQRLTIKAAEGKNPTISWSKTDKVEVTGATDYACIVVYTDVTTYTYFGQKGTTGTLTFDASGASNSNNKGKRARVLMHCGKNRLYIHDGIVMTGGNTGGGNYDSAKDPNTSFPSGSGEVSGMEGAGAGIYMYYGELVMMGGRIHHNYSLYGSSTDHNYVGGGGGVYLNNNTSMLFSGGTIDYNAAASGGGGGILVGYGASLDMSGGVIDSNVTRFSSGAGIGVRTGSVVKITGGTISKNYAVNHGGGLFARGDSVPLEITGGTFSENIAGNDGGAVLFWTVGDDVTKNTVKIGGNVKILNNYAANGGGISIGREVLDGVPIGRKAKLVVEGNAVISGNTAKKNGGGINMQSDEFSSAVNTVEITGGTISNNKAKDGGGIYVPGGTVSIANAVFDENSVTNRGAGLFTGGGTLSIADSTFSQNESEKFGGGAYVVGGTVTMNSGSFTKNSAESGGGIYITKEGTTNTSGFTMKSGTFIENSAKNYGGAVFVNGGNIIVENGELNQNTAANGGAAYVEGGNFTMTSGKMLKNKAIATSVEKAEEGLEGYGGAVYVKGSSAENGNIYIGLEDCTQKVPKEAHKDGKPTFHPIVKNNEAAFGGGLAVNGGKAYLYCCDMTDNTALSNGTGTNVFMSGTDGEIHHHYDPEDGGAIIGENTNHGMVSIGGKLDIHQDGQIVEVEITYHSNYSTEVVWDGVAPDGYYLNLPYCPTDWSAAQKPNKLLFAGWTERPTSDTDASAIRDKDDYQSIGTPVEIKDADPNKEGNQMDFYAVWAPEENNISYRYSLDGKNVVTPTGADIDIFKDYAKVYEFTVAPYTIDDYDVDPAKAGYTFLGWRMYADNSKISNWGADASSYSVTLVSQLIDPIPWNPMGAFDQNFGDITLVAVFEPAYTDLKIEKSVTATNGSDANQSFVFHITGKPDNEALANIDMKVTIQGANSKLIEQLPVGTYKVVELTDWSWRYTPEQAEISNILLNDPEKTGNNAVKASFTNNRKKDKWLSGDCIAKNLWNRDVN